MVERPPAEPRYHLRLMFEWGGGCLWSGNDAARDAFDVGHRAHLDLLCLPKTKSRTLACGSGRRVGGVVAEIGLVQRIRTFRA